MVKLSQRPYALLLALSLLGLSFSALAEKPVAVAPTAKDKTEARVEHITHTDKSVVIEEVRVRGQTQSIEVRPTNPKLRPYSVEPTTREQSPAHRDMPKTGSTNRTWKILDF